MKYIVVGMHASGKQEIFDLLTKDKIKCGKLFSNTPVNDIRYDFFTDKDIMSIFENKAYMFIKELDDYSRECYEGLSLYEYDNKDVFLLSPSQFIAITPQSFSDEVCLIWLDNNKSVRKQRFDDERRSYNFNEVEETERRDVDDFIRTIYNNKKFHVLYFSNEDAPRVETIIYTLVQHPELIKKFEKTFV